MKWIKKQIDTKEKIEGKIIDWISISAGGQLITFKPAADLNYGADLVVKKRAEYYRDVNIYLQIRDCQKKLKENVFINEIKEGEISPRKDFYFLFVYFDIVLQDIFEYVWLIPTDKFFDIIEKDANGILRIELPIDIKTKNKCSPYLVGKKEIGKVLAKIIKAK